MEGNIVFSKWSETECGGSVKRMLNVSTEMSCRVSWEECLEEFFMFLEQCGYEMSREDIADYIVDTTYDG